MLRELLNKLKKRKMFYAFIFTLMISVIASKTILSSFSLLQPVKSVDIFSQNVSYQNNVPGSWKVTKSAKWTSTGKARITVDVDTIMKTEDKAYKDIIMVLDISGSMYGEKLERVKNDSIELINSVLSNSNNKMALISFDSNSTLISGLTNDKNILINDINNLSSTGSTNYYKALLNVEEILKNYTKQSNRECIVMFLTDGYPNQDTPNQIGEYHYLKDTYPYVTFNGIQYEMGSTILEPIKKVSDNQYIASIDTLNNVLFDASVAPLTYEEFTFTDYIDINYFNIASIDNISSKVGDYSLDGNKVTWTIKDELKSGDKATLTIDVTLKNEYLNVGGTYPTNSSETITSKIKDNSEDVTSNLTPILSDKYVVTYDGNAPGTCTVSNVPNVESKSVFTTVQISNKEPICSGYQFKGWEIITEDVEKVNNDYFIMPESDVILRAEWSKLALTKSVNGEVVKVQTLYNIMKEQAVMDNIQSDYVSSSTGIDFTSNNSNTNGKGVYERKGTENDTNPIYYYRGEVEDNNVIFAGFCWKMVITTDTGGVKMIYNGVATDGKCNNVNEETLIGSNKYKTAFGSSPSYVGYMHGAIYTTSNKSSWHSFFNKGTNTRNVFTQESISSNANYYYADYAIWNGTQYVLHNSNDLNDSSAPPVTQYIWSSNYNNLIGKYTCNSSKLTSCDSVKYIAASSNAYSYYVPLYNGDSIDNDRLISKTVRYTEGIGYELIDPVNVAKQANGKNWFTDYNEYIGYYFCDSFHNNICDTVMYVNSANNYQASVVIMSNGDTYEKLINQELLFGNSVDKTGKLIDTISIKYKEWDSKYNTLNNNHYTCFSINDTCSEVYYVYYTTPSNVYYIKLSIGTTVDKALSEMFDYNNYPSSILGDKDNPNENTINYWYYNSIETKTDTNGNNLSDYIEDTSYCNDKSISNLSGWNPNGGSITNHLSFGAQGRSENPSITCPREIDKFTVSESIGNGELKYPVGLLTEDEVRLAGGGAFTKDNDNYYLWNGEQGDSSSGASWWTVTPYEFNTEYSRIYVVRDDGKLVANATTNSSGIRPVISLKPGTRTDGGSGTKDDPYLIEVRNSEP